MVVQKFKSVVQGADENAAEYAKRLEEIVAELKLSTKAIGLPFVMPSLSAASDGRMTIMLTWPEEVEEEKDVDEVTKHYANDYFANHFEGGDEEMTLIRYLIHNDLKIVKK